MAVAGFAVCDTWRVDMSAGPSQEDSRVSRVQTDAHGRLAVAEGEAAAASWAATAAPRPAGSAAGAAATADRPVAKAAGAAAAGTAAGWATADQCEDCRRGDSTVVEPWSDYQIESRSRMHTVTRFQLAAACG